MIDRVYRIFFRFRECLPAIRLGKVFLELYPPFHPNTRSDRRNGLNGKSLLTSISGKPAFPEMASCRKFFGCRRQIGKEDDDLPMRSHFLHTISFPSRFSHFHHPNGAILNISRPSRASCQFAISDSRLSSSQASTRRRSRLDSSPSSTSPLAMSMTARSSPCRA